MNHAEPLHLGVGIRGWRKPTCATKLIAPQSDEADKWDESLEARGYPPLAQIGLQFDGQYEMPVTAAPTTAENIAHRIVISWTEWLRSRADHDLRQHIEPHRINQDQAPLRNEIRSG